MDRELDRDHRDHGVRELDALRLQDGYLLCRVSGMRVSGMRGVVCVVSCVGQSVSNQGVSIRLRVYGYACVCVCVMV